MDRITANNPWGSYTRWGIGFLVVAVLGLSAGPAFGQVANEITSINPDSGAQGTTNLLVTFTLDTDAPPAPPGGVTPDSVMIGSMNGISVTHNSQYIVTAFFNIPAGSPRGPRTQPSPSSRQRGGRLFSRWPVVSR